MGSEVAPPFSAEPKIAGMERDESVARLLGPAGVQRGLPLPHVRAPPKLSSGYLFKQSAGAWKRRRWGQRWFVLDREAGVLRHFRHASPLEAVPFRQDARGALALRQAGASLVIQGDLPRGAPSPFCFTVRGGDGGRELRICANSYAEFRSWTSAISAVLGPARVATRRSSDDGGLSAAPQVAPPVVQPLPVLGPVISLQQSNTAPATDSRPRQRVVVPSQDAGAVHIADEVRALVGDGTAMLIALNPLIVFVRFGSSSTMFLCVGLLNALCIWVLWFRVPQGVKVYAEQSFVNGSGVERHPSAPVASPRIPSITQPTPQACEVNRLASEEEAAVKSVEGSPHAPSSISGTVNGVKAVAGSSIPMCDPEPAEIVSGSWTQLNATRFQVRQGPNYRKTKQKAASAPALLSLLAIDVYQSQNKVNNIASIVDLSNLKSADGSALDLFIVNCQVPSYAPANPLWGEKQGDGPGFNFVSYFAIPPNVREMMRTDDPPLQAVKLLRDFMQTSSNMSERFKAIGIVVNPKDQQLGRTERHLLETYNGQPILTRPQHRFYRGDGYFEVDVDAHEFNYVARKGLSGVSTHFPSMVVDFGFVLEGQEDHELPEHILGGVRLCKIDVLKAPMLM